MDTDSSRRRRADINEQAKVARRAYYKKYYEEHPEAREKKNAYRREWGRKPENKEKLKNYHEKYWLKEGAKQ